ncbi:MAG: transcriptional repressor LexA, partial [Christensenellales bacterium]
RDICAALGLRSTSTVHGYITRLEKNGMLKRQGENKRRALALKTYENQGEFVELPVLGNIAAGQPILAVQESGETMRLPAELVRGNSEAFILVVKGESMIEAGIHNGDRIIVSRTPTAENGEIVVALIDNEATVKRFYKENGHIRLQPENSAMQPIILSDVVILGKVVGLYRRL